MSKTQFYNRRVKYINDLQLDYTTAYNALDGALEDMADNIKERLQQMYYDRARNLRATYQGVLYSILCIKPYHYINRLEVGVRFILERIDDYTPTDAEKRKLAKRPKIKGNDWNNERLLFWLDKDAPIYEWEKLKNQIFCKFDYSWKLTEDDVDGRIERLKLDLRPVR